MSNVQQIISDSEYLNTNISLYPRRNLDFSCQFSTLFGFNISLKKKLQFFVAQKSKKILQEAEKT